MTEREYLDKIKVELACSDHKTLVICAAVPDRAVALTAGERDWQYRHLLALRSDNRYSG